MAPHFHPWEASVFPGFPPQDTASQHARVVTVTKSRLDLISSISLHLHYCHLVPATISCYYSSLLPCFLLPDFPFTVHPVLKTNHITSLPDYSHYRCEPATQACSVLNPSPPLISAVSLCQEGSFLSSPELVCFYSSGPNSNDTSPEWFSLTTLKLASLLFQLFYFLQTCTPLTLCRHGVRLFMISLST